MKTTEIRARVFLACFVITGFLNLLFLSAAHAQAKMPYKNDECVKCHAPQVKEIADAKSKHRSVPCIGCHAGHPPEVKKPYEPCNKCHLKTKKAHFEFAGCMNCHRTPHRPREITFTSADACPKCHAAQAQMLRENKTSHSEVDCFFCHEVHGKKPKCTECHGLHSPGLTVGECKNCHKPHAPVPATYAADTPSRYCGGCHDSVLSTLAQSNAKHKSFACSFCHERKHKMVPQCENCHGSPHPAGIMRKFPKCGTCHNIAHDLNHWEGADIGQESSPPAAGPAVP